MSAHKAGSSAESISRWALNIVGSITQSRHPGGAIRAIHMSLAARLALKAVYLLLTSLALP